MGKRPQAVEVTSWLTWLLVAGGLVVSVYVLLDRHAIADAWSPLHPGDSRVQPVAFVPVVIVLYAVIAGTALLLVAMLRQAQTWSRYGITVLEAGTAIGCFAIMRTAPPTSVRCALVAAAVLAACTLVFLWHPGVTRYLRGSEEDDRTDA